MTEQDGMVKRPRQSCMALTSTVDAVCEEASVQDGWAVERDADAGTVKIFDDEEEEVYWAIQKGEGGPWIVWYCTDAFEEEVTEQEPVEN